jgi:hypothetical protein
MTISYLTPPFLFVDSQFGTATTANVKNLVNQVIDRRYQKQVQKKLFFAVSGMIGPEAVNQGPQPINQTTPGFPVIRKTDLSVVSGDTLKIGLRKNLSFAVSTGKVANTQLVDTEVGFDFDDIRVKVEQWRQGVMTVGGINAQRNPYESFEEIENSLLADWAAQMEDTGILYAMHYGYAPHILRQYGTTNCPPTECANVLYGNDESLGSGGLTIASLNGTGADNFTARTVELAEAYAAQNDFDMVMVNGEPFLVSLVSPKVWAKLFRDPDFRAAMQYARNRGIDNPLFKNNGSIIYSNTIIFRYDKIRSVLGGNNPAGLTVAGPPGAITEAAYTGIGGGVTYDKLHSSYFLGANAIALAEGQFSKAGRIRSENDYQNVIGRAIDSIWGAQRMDYVAPGGSTVDINQSLIKILNTVI